GGRDMSNGIVKVHFFAKERKLAGKAAIGGICLALIILVPSMVAMSMQHYYLAFIWVRIVFIPILLFLIPVLRFGFILSVNRYKKLGDPFERYFSLVFAISLSLLVLLIIWLAVIDTKLGEIVLSCIKIIVVTLYILVLPAVVYRVWWLRKRGLLSMYPQVIAAAEQRTDEYMNGYSARPFETDVDEIALDTFIDFARFLMRNGLIGDYVKRKDSIRLVIQYSFDLLKRNAEHHSWMEISKKGTATIFIAEDTYKYLGTPVSYHLLCRKVAERIKESYELFEQGDEAGALRVFRVERKSEKKKEVVG
ncbi:MAG: hypothetical protein KAU14_07765, partial [Thermoplasmata archaeon]|nr:hypothetical protein [Thermoplasmata archaeon]